MIQEWYEKYCEINGIATRETSSNKEPVGRIPAAPIDFQKVTLNEFKEKQDDRWADF